MRFALIFALAGVLSGCGAAATIRNPQGMPVAVTGAIRVERPENRTGRSLAVPGQEDFDLLAEIQASLEKELERRCFQVAKENGGAYVLKTRVTRYEPGSAFKRGLWPGYGATELEAKGLLLRAGERWTLVAEVESKGKISVGGAFSIGGFRTVAQKVGAEVARSLRAKAGGPGNCPGG